MPFPACMYYPVSAGRCEDNQMVYLTFYPQYLKQLNGSVCSVLWQEYFQSLRYHFNFSLGTKATFQVCRLLLRANGFQISHSSLTPLSSSCQPCFLKDWELQVHFKIHGQGKKNLHGDGLAIWYTKDRMQPGIRDPGLLLHGCVRTVYSCDLFLRRALLVFSLFMSVNEHQPIESLKWSFES